MRFDGTLETLAGNDTRLSALDVSLASEAGLNVPYEVVVKANGRILFTERDANRIRFIHPDRTLARDIPAAVLTEGALAQDVPADQPTS